MQHKNAINDIEFEIQRIETLMEKYQPLLKKIEKEEPSFIEMGSLAMLLHSFYNGLENIFSRIVKKMDEEIPHGEFWHKKLLDRMIIINEKRKFAVLTKETYEDLKEYLGFRHFSRHAYAFDLDWNLMKDLILRLNEIKIKVLSEIKIFIKKFGELKK